MKFFSDFSEGRENNFDFLRFFFASLVIFAHSYAVLYNGSELGYDPFVRYSRSQIGLGGMAVNGFFLISGFLITRSWIYSKGTADYARKRALRILPALVVVLLLTVFVLGPIATNDRSGYFHNPATYRYLGFMLTTHLHATDQLPGVFQANPLPGRVNGSLWTIRCEAICYILVALLGLWGAYRRRVSVLVLALAAMVMVAFMNSLGEFADSFRVSTYFLVGMAFYLYRDRIPYDRKWLIGILSLVAVSLYFHFLSIVSTITGAYLLFYFAFNPKIPLHHFARHGDLSYGIYLYAFPIEQLLVAFYRHSLNIYSLTAATFALAAACAALSWRFIERPALMLKGSSKKAAAPQPVLVGDVREPLADAAPVAPGK